MLESASEDRRPDWSSHARPVDTLLTLLLEDTGSVAARMAAAGFSPDEIQGAWNYARVAGFTESTGLGAEIVEVSLVNYPAYDNAATLSLNQRSFAEEEAHRESVEAHEKTQEVIAWVNARKAAAASKSKTRTK